MRNFSPSALIAVSLFFSCTAFTLQAAAVGNQPRNKGQAAQAAPSNKTSSPAPGLHQAGQPQMPALKSENFIPALTADASTPQPAPAQQPEDAQKPVPAAKEEIATSESPAKEEAGQAAKTSEPPKEEKKKPAPQPAVAVKFDPFTGKITKNKVRVRLQPAFDGPVLRELGLNDLVVVLGESDDFYAIQPPSDVKAYVYRTFVLDNVIEGNRVNARLKPDLDAPVVAQLNSGERVEGVVHPGNNKWMEIKLPASARFYIAKEYVAKAGDASLKGRLEKKHEEAIQLLNTTEGVARAEMQKPFDQINIDGIKLNYEHVMKDYPEFPDAGAKAKEALGALLESYTAKKLAYLENQTRNSAASIEANKKLAAELQAQKSKVNQLEQEIEKNRQVASAPQPFIAGGYKPDQLPINMSSWIPAEESLMARWSQQTGKHSARDFYEDQKKEAFALKGVIDTYTRPVKNKPGDYMLLNSSSKLPIAFLYSTNINLQDYVGHEVSLLVAPRANNNFAFPAYFVLHLE